MINRISEGKEVALNDFPYYLRRLIESSGEILFLLKLFQASEEPDRFKAAEYLIKLQDLDALAYYVDCIKKK